MGYVGAHILPVSIQSVLEGVDVQTLQKKIKNVKNGKNVGKIKKRVKM